MISGFLKLYSVSLALVVVYEQSDAWPKGENCWVQPCIYLKNLSRMIRCDVKCWAVCVYKYAVVLSQEINEKSFSRLVCCRGV